MVRPIIDGKSDPSLPRKQLKLLYIPLRKEECYFDMNLKQKIILLVSVDSAILFLIIYLVYFEMWVEAFLALLLSLGISFWNYPVYKEYFSVKKKSN